MKKEFRIKAVLDSDMDAFLESLGLLERLNTGQLQCAICGKKVTRENFFCVYADDSVIRVCCDDLQCYQIVVSRQAER